MAVSTNIHWKAPSLAVGALFAGFLFALGHHLFYQNLDGTQVPTTLNLRMGIWSGISPQRFNTSVGTLLAFLVKTFLCLAVGIAYAQMLWKGLKARSTKVSVVDSATSLTGNILAFLDFGVWRRYPLLIVLAAVIW